MVQVILARRNYCRHGWTATVAENARVFGLTLKEKQLETIGIHYQQAMESPLQDVSGISSNSFLLQFHRNQAKFARKRLCLYSEVTVT